MSREEFKKLFDTYFDDLRSYLFYRSGNAELSTDIAQDTFMRIWEKQLKILPGREKGLLYKIAGDLFISSFRKQQSGFKFRDHFTLESSVLTPEDDLAYKELLIRYHLALEKIGELQRATFLMSRNEGLKYKEIAERLNISVKAVEKRINTALEILKKELN